MEAQKMEALEPSIKASILKPKPKVNINPVKTKHKVKVQEKVKIKEVTTHEMSVVSVARKNWIKWAIQKCHLLKMLM